MGFKDFIDKSIDIVSDYILAPMLLIGVLGLIGAGCYFAYDAFKVKDISKAQDISKEHIVKIDNRYWACTSTHIYHHQFRSGMLTRFGRMSDTMAYDSTECDQWSAAFNDEPGASCPNKNVWCQENQPDKLR